MEPQMKKLVILLSLLAGACGLEAGPSEDVGVVSQALETRAIVSTTTTHPTLGLTKTKYLVQNGSDPMNRFAVTRVRSSHAEHPVILHGPFGYGIEWYELNERPGYRRSFIGSLATLGFDVWVIDDRLSKQVPGTCEVTGCPAMGDWTVQLRIDDAEFVRQLVLDEYTPSQKIVIGGYVGGAMFAQATVNAHPDHYAGLFLWEGTMVAGPETQAYAAPSCALLEFVTSTLGIYYDTTPQLFALMFQLAATDPDGLSPLPFIPGLEFLADKLTELGITNATNQEVYYVITTQHLDNPNWATPDFIFLAGDVENGFTYASEERYNLVAGILDPYASLVTLRDLTCAFAGETTYTDNLDAFTGKVLALGGTKGFGDELEVTMPLYTNATTQIFVNENFGESDRFFHTHRALFADVPFAAWASTVF